MSGSDGQGGQWALPQLEIHWAQGNLVPITAGITDSQAEACRHVMSGMEVWETIGVLY